MRLVAVVLVGVLVVGCDKGNGTSSSSSSGGSTSQDDIGAFMIRVLKAQCAFDQRCLATNGPRHSSVAACEAAAEALFAAYGTIYTSRWAAGGQAAQDTCVADLVAGACEAGTNVAPPSCKAALVEKNLLALGATCSSPGQSVLEAGNCGWDAECVTGSNGCGVCTASMQLASGEACGGSNQHCPQGLYCGGTPPTCRATVGVGGACENYQACTGNLTCEGSTNPTCQSRVAVGASCEEASCVQDAQCHGAPGSRTCKVRLDDGVACGRTMPGCKNYCVFASADAATGTCQPLGAPPTSGPCALTGAYSTCKYPEAYPDETRDGTGAVTACTCRARHATGSCTSSQECTVSCEGINHGTTPPGPGTCSALKANGEPCNNDNECTSTFCSGGDSPVCAPVPSCA
jgi:hypothetical protein